MSRKNGKSEFLSAWGKATEVWTAIVNAVQDQDPEHADELLRELKDDPDRLAEIGMIVARKKQAERQPIETVTVPDLPAKALLAVVKEQAGLTYLNPAYQQYGFVRGERGKTYEVLKWKPGRGVSSDAVREHFRALGFAGNAAAFVSWVARNHPVGWFVSIPEDDECFVGGGDLHAPCFGRGGSDRELGLGGLAGGWFGGFVFVAFREIPQK